MEIQIFRKLFEELCFAFDKPFEDGRALVYYNNLKEISDSKLEHSINICKKTCNFFPTISEIRNTACLVNVAVSWQKVLKIARRGCKDWEELNNLEIASLGEIGGIQVVKDSSDEGLTFLFNRFKQAFDILSKRNIQLSEEEQWVMLGAHPECVVSLERRRGSLGTKKDVAQIGDVVKGLLP